MESKKDIGKLFRENLEQLDYTPSAKVWEQIELDLEKKKKKRRFFIWFFFATIITSSLLIGLGYTFSDGNPFTNKEVKENSVSNGKTSKTNTAVVAEEGNNESSDSKKATEKTNSNTTEVDKQNGENILNTNAKKSKTASKNNSKISNRNKSNSNSSVASTVGKNKRERKNKNSNSALSGNSFKKGQTSSDKSIAEVQKTSSKETSLQSETPINNNTTILNTEKSIRIDSLIAATNDKKKIEKKNIKEKDSLKIKDSLTEDKEKPKEYEIVVAPYYGMNYNGYFGDFNSISNNTILEKKGDMRSAYGVLVRWMFGNKLGIQIGAGKINNRYFSTVEKNGNVFINTQNVDTDKPIAELNGIFASSTKVKFTYESSYIEVPLEAYYVLRDKKLGLATSFGISMLFGGKNSVFAESENVEKMKIGKLNTNSPTSATANAKLYLFYKITPSLQLDLYPTFQYQIIGNTDSNYSSYFFSVRTGFSYKL